MSIPLSKTALKEIASHHRRLGLKFRLKGMPYERCAELSWIIEYLRPSFHKPLRYLDIGTGESPLPSFLSTRTKWDITCLDKCKWVRDQAHFERKSGGSHRARKPLSIIEADLFATELPAACFDVITCISVIEHFEGNSDSAAMEAMARLLHPGGTLVLTTLMNDGFFAEFYLRKEVYGTAYREAPVFYQRHYDVNSIFRRLIQPSGLLERQRAYFGDYGFQCFEKLLQQPKPIKALYSWSTPRLARHFLSYRSQPISRKEMRMNTASGVILALEKPSAPVSPNPDPVQLS